MISKKKSLRRYSKAFSGRNQKFIFCITIFAEFGAMFDGTLYVFFLSSTSTQISIGGRLNLDGGTLNLDGGRVPLQFKYWLRGLRTRALGTLFHKMNNDLMTTRGFEPSRCVSSLKVNFILLLAKTKNWNRPPCFYRF